MRIICIEEHAIDSGLSQASSAALRAEAPYLSDVRPIETDPPTCEAARRPWLVGMKKARELGADIGAGRLAEMDRHGIDMQIVSFSEYAQLAAGKDGVELCRLANDRLAEAVRKHPDRFGGFAVLPWQDPAAAARELARAVTELGLRGTLLMGRPGPTFLDDAIYAPVLEQLNELRVPIYVHPGAPLPQVQKPYYGGLDPDVSARLSLFGWGWHNEAGVHVLRLIFSRQFEKYPHLRVISGHWGEMVPFYLQRLDDAIPRESSGLARSVSDTYRAHVYVTPSGMLNRPHFDFIHQVIGADRIIYSVDYPYATLDGAREFLEKLPIPQADREKIAFRNAEALFRLR